MYGQFFGEFLLQKGIVTRLQLDEGLRLQQERNRPLGLMAIDFGLLSTEQVVRILEEQLISDEPFGQVAVRLGLLSEESLRMLLSQQAEEHLLIGQALIAKGYVRMEEIERLLVEFRRRSAQEEHSFRLLLEERPHGELLLITTPPIHRCLCRVVSGMVKVDELLTAWKEPSPSRTILIRLSREQGGCIDLGVHIPRMVLLPFVYCLLQRETWSDRIIDEALVSFGRSLAYAVSAGLSRAGIPATTEGVHVQGASEPVQEAVVLRMNSGIGPVYLSFSAAEQSDGAG
jgi:hypothetical protein